MCVAPAARDPPLPRSNTLDRTHVRRRRARARARSADSVMHAEANRNVISMMKAFRMFRLLKLTRQYGGSIVIARVLRAF